MNFPTGLEEGIGIINSDKPIDYDKKKKVDLCRGIYEEEYDEVITFLRRENKMPSENFTMLSKEEIKRYTALNAYTVLMRAPNSELYGTIFSVPFPMKINSEILTFGCTSFLNVHSKIRKFKMCMILIRELAQYGFENNVLCSYQLSAFKMCETAIEVNSWFRPINLIRSLLLGFTYPGYNEISNFNKNRILYKCKVPKGFTVKQVKGNYLEALKFYQDINQNNKFVFYPSEPLFEKWIKLYPSYLVFNGKEIIGFFTLGTINCKMSTGAEGTLCSPLLFNCVKGKGDIVLKSLLSIAEEKDYDLLYGNQIGDLTPEVYQSVNAIKNKDVSYFSLYNNSIKLKCEDIFTPLF